ncbi:MAG: 16S rRNA processing protein RimM [Candidatus Latescibacterota bacterium]|nr:MAG: 16S rRNA processing protein RimM [Candidatus Latescibacterota bacterium]
MTDVFLGRLVKAFGIRGEIKLHPTDDFWEEVLASKCLTLRRETTDGVEEEPVIVKRYRPHKNSYVVTLDGVADRNQAEALVGGELFIDDEKIDVELPKQKRPFQIIGTTVKDADGAIVGEVTSVIFSAAHDVYEVSGGGRVFLVPAVPEFIVSMDEEKRELVIRPVPGLMDES